MFFTLSEQLRVVLYAMLLGMLLGVCYDVLRTIRRRAKAGIGLTTVCDIVFWVITLLAFFEFSIAWAPGHSRAYVLFGIVMGGMVYFCSFSAMILFGMQIILDFLIETVITIHAFIKLSIAVVREMLKKIAENSQKILSFFEKKV